MDTGVPWHRRDAAGVAGMHHVRWGCLRMS